MFEVIQVNVMKTGTKSVAAGLDSRGLRDWNQQFGKGERDCKEDSWISDMDHGLTHRERTPVSDEVGRWKEKTS